MQKIRKEDCKVEAFIDQRGKEIGGLMNHPVYDLRQAQERLSVKDVIVIVAVKNVFEIPAPIAHPWFYEYVCTSDLFFISGHLS